ncbi:MAG TPA: right-handed parallel beta-helix repeat-containing protein [Thermoleophilaceae bacterium]|nr:right-handed parallel beta-helix repeat-containing protein [Thermoleophilaceae bacterium]
MSARPLLIFIATTTAVLAIATGVAVGHVERSSYWPDPAPDTSVRPAAGGKVPKARGLASALRRKARGDTYVVCKSNSLRKAKRSIRSARRKGWKVRPTARTRKLSKKGATRLRRINKRLAERCKFRHIQAAVKRAGNNDRVVVMPGLYLEEPSRRKPTDDPKCVRYEEESENGQGAATYRYQVNCPNDQNLIFVQGRALTDETVPFPPREDRRGIPDEGACIRCNLQLEGSGVKAGDVVVDLAEKPKETKLRGPADPIKDVAIRADRADGFVLRNMTFAHANEHGIYVHETDGYLLSRFKVFYSKEYGTLTFTSDHGRTADCEAMGHGDAGVYPGAGPETMEQTTEGARRSNQLITRCDVHHNTLGYSGTMGNGTRVARNNFYDNTTGITTDSFFAGGHPGYPQDGAIFENNNIYSNNFNSYESGSDVEPRVPVPVGVGIMIAGGNGNEIRGNRIWDNWRRGTMLFQVPDALSGSSGTNSVSHRNRQHDNVMGLAPNGDRVPNGVDFWWDDAPAQEDNCWFDNGEVTTVPAAPIIPSNCENTSVGATYGAQAAELLGCAGSISSGEYDATACAWFRTPPKPSGSQQSSGTPLTLPLAASAARPRLTAPLSDFCVRTGTTLSCAPFRDRL